MRDEIDFDQWAMKYHGIATLEKWEYHKRAENAVHNAVHNNNAMWQVQDPSIDPDPTLTYNVLDDDTVPVGTGGSGHSPPLGPRVSHDH